MKQRLLFLMLAIMIISNSITIQGAEVKGTIYDLNLDVVKETKITINTQPKQMMITKEGTYNFEKKVVGLPINRQVLFWVGIALILSAFFKSYGNFAAFLIGIGVTFAAFTGKNIVVDVIGQKERTPASSTTSPENTPQKK